MVFTKWLTAEVSNGASLETQCCLMLIIMTSALLHPNVGQPTYTGVFICFPLRFS